jgi:hypothetical protein
VGGRHLQLAVLHDQPGIAAAELVLRKLAEGFGEGLDATDRMQCQKNVWFQVWAALLKTFRASGLSALRWMISPSDSDSKGVPAISSFKVSTYFWWCLPW